MFQRDLDTDTIFQTSQYHHTIRLKNISLNVSKQQNVNKRPGKIKSKPNLEHRLPLNGKKRNFLYLETACLNICKDGGLLKN